jgi:hypothetical protein
MDNAMQPLADVGAMDSGSRAIVRERVLKYFGVEGGWL